MSRKYLPIRRGRTIRSTQRGKSTTRSTGRRRAARIQRLWVRPGRCRRRRGACQELDHAGHGEQPDDRFGCCPVDRQHCRRRHTFSFIVPDSDALTLNWVRVQLDFAFDTFDNIKIALTSPGGASSVLLDQPNDGSGANVFDNSVQLSSDQFWGQNSVGTWTVSFSNANPSFGSLGTLFSAGLVLVGDPPTGSNTDIYTDEYNVEAGADAAREVLSDPDSSGDTLNLAAVTEACSIDLVAGAGGNIGGTPFVIGSGTRVTTVYTGSGDDTIVVNGLTDSITSEGGSDTVVFPNARADYMIGGSVGRTMVTLGDVTDTLNNVTALRFADQNVTVSNLGLIACFAPGTRLRGEEGDVPVEAMCVGDRICAHFARTSAPIIWIGRRRVDCSRHPRPNVVWPVRIVAGAFGKRLPNRDLLLSPDHAVFVDDVLIPVKYLINGMTILREPINSITYLHVELPRHDVVLAEGLPVETFLDTCSGSVFATRADTVALHPDFGSRVWEAEVAHRLSSSVRRSTRCGDGCNGARLR